MDHFEKDGWRGAALKGGWATYRNLPPPPHRKLAIPIWPPLCNPSQAAAPTPPSCPWGTPRCRAGASRTSRGAPRGATAALGASRCTRLCPRCALRLLRALCLLCTMRPMCLLHSMRACCAAAGASTTGTLAGPCCPQSANVGALSRWALSPAACAGGGPRRAPQPAAGPPGAEAGADGPRECAGPGGRGGERARRAANRLLQTMRAAAAPPPPAAALALPSSPTHLLPPPARPSPCLSAIPSPHSNPHLSFLLFSAPAGLPRLGLTPLTFCVFLHLSSRRASPTTTCCWPSPTPTAAASSATRRWCSGTR